MCGIVAGGNFGWFNLLTAVLCAPLCVDGADGEADGAAADGAAADGAAERRAPAPVNASSRAVDALVAVYTALSALFFVPAEWCSPGVLYWSDSSPPSPRRRRPAPRARRVARARRLAARGDVRRDPAADGRPQDRRGLRRRVARPQRRRRAYRPRPASDRRPRVDRRCRTHQTDDSDGGASPAPWCVAPYFPRGEFSMWYSQFVAITRRENLLPPLAQAHARSSASFDESVAPRCCGSDDDADGRGGGASDSAARARSLT